MDGFAWLIMYVGSVEMEGAEGGVFMKFRIWEDGAWRFS